VSGVPAIFIINASAGLGLVLILRWYWWRVNAWSEISAMIAPLIIYPVSVYGFGMESPMTLYPIVFGTTIVWLIVTYLTKPVEEKKLLEFYKRTHPGGAGWKHIQKKLPGIPNDTEFGRLFINWLMGVILIYSFLFGIGKIIFADYLLGILLLAAGFTAAAVIFYNINRNKNKSLPIISSENPEKV
jgi:Na+/proline symporter